MISPIPLLARRRPAPTAGRRAFAAVAVERGCAELRAEPDPWACYQGGVYACRRQRAVDNAATVAGFIRATLAATDWILGPANGIALPELLQRHLPHMSGAAARAASENLTGPEALLKPGLPIDREGLGAVLALPAEYGAPPGALGPPEKYLDLSFYNAVARPG